MLFSTIPIFPIVAPAIAKRMSFSFRMDLLSSLLCISASMAYNAAILGQARTKIVFNMLIATLAINVSLIIINLL